MSSASPAILCLIETLGRGGGAEQLLAALAPEMRRRGIDIEVAAIHDWPQELGEEMSAGGVPIHRLHTPRRAPLVGIARLRALLTRRRYNLFWGHLLSGNAYARIAQMMTRGSRSVMTLHSEHGGRPSRHFKHRLMAAVEAKLLGSADQRVAVSAAVARSWEHALNWRDILLAYNGIDSEAIRRISRGIDRHAARARHSFAADAFLIVTPARYVAQKGQIFLIEAIAQLREQGVPAHLVLCGEGPDEAHLRATITEMQLNTAITMAPVLPQADLFPLVRAADAFVLPSLHEAFGIAAAEAIAIGTPAVITDVGGFRELVGDSDGATLVPARNAGALAAALATIYAAPERARTRAERGAHHVIANFGIERCAIRWITLLNAIHRAEKLSSAA